MEPSPIRLVISVLAVWRVTHFLVNDDGPGRIMVRVRAASNGALWQSLWACFHCMSLWVALAPAALIGHGWIELALIWLALSGAACLLQRIGQHREPPAALYFEGEQQEENHELLRQLRSRDQ